MGNLGRIAAKVLIGGAMPGIGYDTVLSGDTVSTHVSEWVNVEDITGRDAQKHYAGRADGPPNNVEFITDQSSGTLMAVPLRQWKQVANYVDGAPGSTTTKASPRIVWKALPKTSDPDLSSTVGAPYIEQLITNTKQTMLTPAAVAALTSGSTSYSGPTWKTPRAPKIVLPVDPSIGSAVVATTGTSPTADDYSTAYVSQESICQDVWWSIETKSMAVNKIGTPFFLDIAMKQPLSSKQPTFLAIRIGDVGSTSADEYASQNVFDLVFIFGRASFLYDRGMMTGSIPLPDFVGPPQPLTPVFAELPGQLTWDNKVNRIGFFPVAGRLCISVNGQDCVYTRIDQTPVPDGTTLPATSTVGKAVPVFPSTKTIRVIGSNSQAIMGIESMRFQKDAAMHLPMACGFDPGTNESSLELLGTKSGSGEDNLSGGSSNITSLVVQPKDGGSQASPHMTLGAFARKIHENGADFDLPSMVGSGDADNWAAMSKDYMNGEITLSTVSDAKGNLNNKHYVITLASDESSFGESDASTTPPVAFSPILSPVFFRLRGMKMVQSATPPAVDQKNVSNDVMEMSESISSDRYITSHSVDITLYNEGGKYDSIGNKSVPVQVGFVWGDAGSGVSTNVFTGVALSSSRSLIAGKETISIHCEDYMYILGCTLVVNSPYYDGMDGFNVVNDLASRAGISNVIDETTMAAGQRYFIPSGYSFVEPAKRYDPKSSIKDCIADVCKMGAKVVYFDGDGALRYSPTQGSQDYSTPTSTGIVIQAKYFSDPNLADDKHTVLDELRTETKLNSTVNRIFIKSIDRTTRSIIMMGASANGSGVPNLLSYWKTAFISMPSLGSLEAVQTQIEIWKKLFFKPVLGVTFKVADDAPLIPMSFVQVDGKTYRVMSMNRSFSTSDNSITTSITGEWMGIQ